APVGDTVVAEVLIAGRDFGLGIGRDGNGGVHPAAFQVYEVPKAIGVLVHGVQAEIDCIGEGLVQVGGKSPVPIGSTQQGNFAEAGSRGFLADAVNHPAASAAAEHHRVRSLERFHAFEIVQ